MTHFGILCPAETGHLNTVLPLGCELQSRGHEVSWIGILDGQPKVLSAGLNFLAIAESDCPQGTMARLFADLGKLKGLTALRQTGNVLKQSANWLLRDAPGVIKKAGVEALIIDQVTASPGGTLAQFLDLPYVNVCSALVLNYEDSIPPCFSTWRYNPTGWARLRNRAGYVVMSRVTQPIRQVVSEYRQQWQLPPYSKSDELYSKLAIISQQPAQLEYSRSNLPPWFHFTGPYHSSSGRKPVDFPFEKLTGQPLIYASMGTLQNRLQYVFRYIAEACHGLDAQLVISLGDSAEPESLLNLPGNPLVVKYAPQLDLLQKASLTITHAGLNTTLESLSNGVPLVAIPITNDQPGVAARIAWTGVGEFVPLSRLSVPNLRAAVQKVLTENSYKQNAIKLQQAIQRSGGVTRAADIVEQAISTGKPVLAHVS
ncbi:MAG: Zeaxanthin glucosyltransferase [Chroococcidiopsis sp. SAG 2025]|uniref:glycosyltransferase n=1 Tax=Chroococcidiopsis sp. SAG 2025 TaxID=171389 RepID=UPI002937039E|nr:glycosyltransferase [Chroococcidiopsis sp. SAG 2025]MDV2991616.1 Zeaxanthin glucosyltransferase [Chroococcidiopsis sp. SAG 2025]